MRESAALAANIHVNARKRNYREDGTRYAVTGVKAG
jgi:hypothetical protein